VPFTTGLDYLSSSRAPTRAIEVLCLKYLAILAAWFSVVVDVHGQSAALYDAFWPVSLLRRGLRQGKALPAPKYRHLRTYYDNRFAQDMGLLFCLANTRMRHEVNQAASATVYSSGRAFEQFKEAINDEDFEDLLKDAQADPKGVAAQDLHECRPPRLPFGDL